MWLRTALATIGLAAILSCGALSTASTSSLDRGRYPPAPPMLLILSGANGARGRRPAAGMPAPTVRLALPPLVTSGSMAYSLYLWHWLLS